MVINYQLFCSNDTNFNLVMVLNCINLVDTKLQQMGFQVNRDTFLIDQSNPMN